MEAYNLILKWLIPILVGEILVIALGVILGIYIVYCIVRYYVQRRRKPAMSQYWKEVNAFSERMAQCMGIIPKPPKPWWKRLFRL
jgi:hypothetical protein